MRKPVLTTAAIKLSHRLIYFSGIGALSAAIHLLIVFYLVNYQEVQPLLANIFAFLTAFNVSYLGHKYLTFASLQHEKKLSLPHFFGVASSAGLLNELLYFLLLRYSPVHYLISLIAVLGFVSIYSFLLSRYWACR